MISIVDIVGILGVAIILITYFLLQLGKLIVGHAVYSALNFIGSFMILFSLFFNWNLPAALIEIFWMLISLFGIVKSLRLRLQKRHEGN